MEQLNYRKLINLKKRFDKYDCDNSKEILAVIDRLIIKEDIIRKEKKVMYQYDDVECETCGKTMLRANIYRHKKDVCS